MTDRRLDTLPRYAVVVMGKVVHRTDDRLDAAAVAGRCGGYTKDLRPAEILSTFR